VNWRTDANRHGRIRCDSARSSVVIVFRQAMLRGRHGQRTIEVGLGFPTGYLHHLDPTRPQLTESLAGVKERHPSPILEVPKLDQFIHIQPL
jgi:hypothetical protein